MAKIRLDTLLLNQSLAKSRDAAKRLIMAGKIRVNDQCCDKPGTLISPHSTIQIVGQPRLFVSRGAEKLQGALDQFNLPISNRIGLDIGISNGGFTDLLLSRELRFMFGIDVAYGVTDYSLRSDDRVALWERCNARHLSPDTFFLHWKPGSLAAQYCQKIDLVLIDVSFISVTKILPQLPPIVRPNTDYIVLIKPQFESTKDEIPDGGVISDEALIQTILDRVSDQITALGFLIQQRTPSPLKGAKGNQEHFFWITSS